MFENQFGYKHWIKKTKNDMPHFQIGYMAHECPKVGSSMTGPIKNSR